LKLAWSELRMLRGRQRARILELFSQAAKCDLTQSYHRSPLAYGRVRSCAVVLPLQDDVCRGRSGQVIIPRLICEEDSCSLGEGPIIQTSVTCATYADIGRARRTSCGRYVLGDIFSAMSKAHTRHTRPYQTNRDVRVTDMVLPS
jgi:hypothetical protein